jgi:hypothetical protein
MKKLIPASILGLMFAFALRAQQPLPAVPKLTNPFLSPPANIGVWSVMKGRQDSQKHELLVPQARKLVAGIQNFRAGEITLAGTFEKTDTGVCSVPLLEANAAPANDPGIAATLSDHSVPIRQAHVPAPSCKK